MEFTVTTFKPKLAHTVYKGNCNQWTKQCSPQPPLTKMSKYNLEQ